MTESQVSTYALVPPRLCLWGVEFTGVYVLCSGTDQTHRDSSRERPAAAAAAAAAAVSITLTLTLTM